MMLTLKQQPVICLPSVNTGWSDKISTPEPLCCDDGEDHDDDDGNDRLGSFDENGGYRDDKMALKKM